MRARWIRSLGFLAGFAFGAGCSASDSDLTPPIIVTPIDISIAIQQSLLADVGSFPSALGVLGVPGVGLVPAFNPLLCTFRLADQSFTCPTIQINQLRFDVKYFLYDSLGISLPRPTNVQVATVRTVVDVTGSTQSSVGFAIGTALVHHHTDVIVTGLDDNVRTVNGATRIDDTVTTDGNFPRAQIELTSVASNLTLPFGAGPFPETGTVTIYSVTTANVGSPPILVTVPADALLIFNGTSTGALVSTVGGVTTSCLVDLTGLLAPRC